MFNLFGENKKADEAGKVKGNVEQNPLQNELVGTAEKNVEPEELERRKQAKEKQKDEKVSEDIKEQKKQIKEAKKKASKMRIVLTSEEWAGLPDPIPKANLLKYSKDQKSMNINASKMASDSFNKTKEAITEVGNQTTKILGTPGQATGQQQPEQKKAGLLGLGWFGLGGKRRRKRTRRKRKRRKKKSRKKTKRRRRRR
tara:strand:+ start:5301 stop:5897 length:597 start_codon:yes stop_codon:yes gene_type:complete